MDRRALLIHLESPYATHKSIMAPARNIVISGLNWPTEYWPSLAVNWIEQGFPIDKEIAALLDGLSKNKNFSQALRHKAFSLVRRWERKEKS